MHRLIFKVLVRRLGRVVVLNISLVAHPLVLLGVHFAPLMHLGLVVEIAFRFIDLCLFYALFGLMGWDDILEAGDTNSVQNLAVSAFLGSVIGRFIKRAAKLYRILFATILLVGVRRAHLNIMDTFVEKELHSLLLVFSFLLFLRRLWNLACIYLHLVVLVLLDYCIIRVVVMDLVGSGGWTA